MVCYMRRWKGGPCFDACFGACFGTMHACRDTVIMMQELQTALEYAIQVQPQIAARGVSNLLVDAKGQPFTSSSYSKYFSEEVLPRAGITERLVPRGLRYSFCTFAEEGGIPEGARLEIATIMGHKPEMWPR